MQEHEHDATPQADLGLRHAGFQIRFVAGLVDLVALAAPAYLIISLFFGIGWGLGGEESELTSTPNLVNTAILTAITVLLWVNWDGRTPGKKLTHIRLASYPNYGGIGYWPALVRSLVGAVSAFTVIGYVVIAVMVGMRKDKRGYHDLIARTCVIHDEPK
jgi:uncharacterized RDD family membrane protein YckC